ncbi:hypothetical protein PRZ48_014065 [Zasmidium cellare]|uniref:Major facilitator superfamily (MFS) profile domain-containing protein n=1 Tax=Zasmidium cellare TaxID=395010 RepID=A0ABR0DZX6_ZASCE|nr:hypothetical protein PRZ48_014065 [Zasmidium cellare]
MHEKAQDHPTSNAEDASEAEYDRRMNNTEDDLVYDNADEEPELHVRTVVACVAMFLLNFVQLIALNGPPAVLPFIGESLDATEKQSWVPNSLSLVQAILGPLIASASDAFQARKAILLATCTISFIGSAIAPGAQSIGRLIAAQTLIGVGFAAVPLAYCIPSEILPRKWRPAVQGLVNVVSALGAISGTLAIGGLTRSDTVNGWRDYYWIQFALWGFIALAILFGYKPPKRHTRYDHLSLWQKIGKLDLVGFFLLTTGLALFLPGLNLGGEQYPWSNSRVLATLITGVALLVGFGLYEWKGTAKGILHHDLFANEKGHGRAFALCVMLIFIEGILLFSIIIFYPILTTSLFETDPFLNVARGQAFWIAYGITTGFYGYWSTRLRSLRTPLAVGFTIMTAGIVGLAPIQPNDSTSAIIFDGLAGIGFGSPITLIVASVQLAVPHHLIATATAVTTSARAIAATIFTASYFAAFSDRSARLVPEYVAPAAFGAGLPRSSLMPFTTGLTAHNQTALSAVPGVNSAVIAAGTAALKQAMADSNISLLLLLGLLRARTADRILSCANYKRYNFLPGDSPNFLPHLSRPPTCIDLTKMANNNRVEVAKEEDIPRLMQIIIPAFEHMKYMQLVGYTNTPENLAVAGARHLQAWKEHAKVSDVPFCIKCTHTDPTTGQETLFTAACWAIYDRPRPEELYTKPIDLFRAEWVEDPQKRKEAQD